MGRRQRDAEIERAKTIAKSARDRLDAGLAAFRKAMYGDLEYHRDALHVRDLDRQARDDPPPRKGVRAKLIPNWAWNKLRNGR